MDNHQHTPQCVHAQRYEPLLTNRIGVFEGHCHVIAKRLLGMGKAHAMLAKVAARLGGIELEVHALVCISNAYCQWSDPRFHATPT
jgi:hypothetical protein